MRLSSHGPDSCIAAHLAVNYRILIEVKYRRGAIKHEHLLGLQSFCGQAEYNSAFGLLVTQDTTGEVADNIIALPAFALLSAR